MQYAADWLKSDMVNLVESGSERYNLEMKSGVRVALISDTT